MIIISYSLKYVRNGIESCSVGKLCFKVKEEIKIISWEKISNFKIFHFMQKILF